MKLTINGQEENLDGRELTVIGLLKLMEVKMPEMVSVQVNGDILKRDRFATTFIKENDRIEFLYFMGGG